jgi:cytidylate kinase
MENVLLKYMERRYKQKMGEDKNPEPGPLVTLSRQTGCPANRIAKLLAQKINENNPSRLWRTVSKEILHEAAKELDMEPSSIEYVFNYEEKSTWDDILSSLSTRYYKSDKKIRKTIEEVIRNIGLVGNAIIIGRGGVAITKDIPRSLHVNLQAPLEWRAIRISQKTGKNMDQARKYVLDIDEKRKRLRDSFQGKDTDYTWFDVTFNCMTLRDDEIAESILKLMLYRDII